MLGRGNKQMFKLGDDYLEAPEKQRGSEKRKAACGVSKKGSALASGGKAKSLKESDPW